MKSRKQDPTGSFELYPDRIETTLDAALSLPVAVLCVSGVITLARKKGIPNVMVVASTLGRGRPSPSQAERFFCASQWAEASRGCVRVALVIRPEMVDPSKFGTLVATNRGMAFAVFESEAEAREWLVGECE